MNLPITPLTVTAATQLVHSVSSTVVDSVERGLSFAELLTNSGPKTGEVVDATDSAKQQLDGIRERLLKTLREAGVDLGFRVDLVAASEQLRLESVHPDGEQIEAALARDNGLTGLFRELEQTLRQRYPDAARDGSLRLQLDGEQLRFDFQGDLFS